MHAQYDVHGTPKFAAKMGVIQTTITVILLYAKAGKHSELNQDIHPPSLHWAFILYNIGTF